MAFTIQEGDLIFVRGISWIDHEIEEITDSPYSHVAGFVSKTELIEAQGFRRIGYRSPHDYKGESDIFRCGILTDQQRARIFHYVISEIGGYYDYPLIAWEFCRYVFHILLPYKEPFDWRDCGTLYDQAFKKEGIILCPGIRYPSPGDLAKSNLLNKIGAF